MGEWDELCLLCGISGEGGPLATITLREIKTLAKQIAKANEDFEEDITTIIYNAFTSLTLKSKKRGYIWFPEGVKYAESYDACIAIGYFVDDLNIFPRPERRYPDGRHVRVRRVVGHSSGDFERILKPVGTEVISETYSHCSARGNNPSFYLCERCYVSLKMWLPLDRLPPRLSPTTSELDPITFDGELYEIVHSQKAIRDYTALLPYIDYGGIQASLEQWQDSFVKCRRGFKNVMSAIRAGLRGKDLILPLLRDCRGWMFMRPDIWPTPSEDESHLILFQTFNSDGGEQTAPLIALLPTEIFQQILRVMSLSSLLNLSATCRMLRSVITEPSFLDFVLKEALRDGNLHWILPIESFRDEKQRAYKAVRLWIPDGSSSETSIKDSTINEESLSPDARSRSDAPEIDMASIPSIESLILSPTFPRLAFIRACWDSDYMMNRKRIWEQVKQFEKLWIDYRINGWKVDRFFPSADILDKVDSF